MRNFDRDIRTRIIYNYLNSVMMFMDLEKKAQPFNTDQVISNSEIHLMKVIYENRDSHVTGVAEKLGITKGAVSQSINKLEKKGLVSKRLDSSNSSKYNLFLTKKGKTAHHAHMNYHQMINDHFFKFLKNFSEKELNTVETFITRVTDVFKELNV